MFGYIGPEKSELRIKDWTLYRAFYCGLCKTLGERFGQVPRLTLSYDCTFIAVLLGSFYPCTGCEEHRCIYKPLRSAQPVIKPFEGLEFAADLNVTLALFHCRDEWLDEKRIRGAAGSLALSFAEKKVKASRSEVYTAVSKGIAALSRLEGEKCADLDAPADAFGSLMRESVKTAPMPEESRKTVGALIYYLGKWVYLMDAWEDRSKDRVSGAYNPFLSSGAGEGRASFLLNASLNEAIKAYTLLEPVSAKGILDNIFYEGCANRTEKLLKAGGENEQ